MSERERDTQRQTVKVQDEKIRAEPKEKARGNDTTRRERMTRKSKRG